MASITTASSLFYSFLYKHILEFEYNRLTKIEADINLRNIAFGGTNTATTFNGNVSYAAGRIKGAKATPLNENLIPEMNKIIMEKVKFAQERDYIKNCCSFLINDEMYYEDFRNIIPDLFIKHIPVLRQFPRTQDPYFTIIDKPTLLKQWMKAEGMLEYYLANRMIFG